MLKDNIVVRSGEIVAKNWKSNYRYHDGAADIARCVLGTVRTYRRTAVKQPTSKPAVDCLTFSVVPMMTAIWTRFIGMGVSSQPLRVLLGDCSGSLHHYLQPTDGFAVSPLINYHHGDKLDLFLYNLSCADYVVVTDDDIFWFDDTAWRWAMEQFAKDPQIAVVSLLPKASDTTLFEDPQKKPMGSCFVLRRDVWIKEQLSFKVDRSPYAVGKGRIFDTGEKAQALLYERGYKIVLPPEEIQSTLVEFNGVSSWTLKIQKHKGELQEIIARRASRQRKAYSTVLIAREMSKIYAELHPEKPFRHMIDPALLARTEEVVMPFLTSERKVAIEERTAGQLARIRDALFGR